MHTSPLCRCGHEQRYHVEAAADGCSWVACPCAGFDSAPTRPMPGNDHPTGDDDG